MIVSFRDDWLPDFFVEDVRSKRIPSELESRLFRKIQVIDDAATDQDLRGPPSNHFEKLRGNLIGFHSIRVNPTMAAHLSPDFWLNLQRRSDLWEAMHSPRERERIKRARPLTAAA